MKANLILICLLALPVLLGGCAVSSIPAAGAKLAGAALKVVSPVARNVSGGRDEKIYTLGARVGSFGAGVWAGEVPGDRDTLTPAEKRRLEEIEAWIHRRTVEEALEDAPDK